MRDSTIIYRSFYEAIKELPAQNQAEVWNAVFEYSLNFQLIELSGLSKTIFTLIKPQLDANLKRYQSGTTPKQKRTGSETEAKPKRNESETEAKVKQTVSETEANVNDNEKVNDNDNENQNPLNNQATVVATEKKIDIPSDFPFQSEYAKQAMRDYISHRRQLKVKPYTKIGLERAMKEWEQWGEAVFIEAVNNTISKNYQGIFHPKDNLNNNKNGYTYTPQKITGRVEPAPHGTPFGKL
jgi:hypothetical protein